MNQKEAFIEFSKNDDSYIESLKIVKSNSKGKIWLMGGYLYRGIWSQKYGIEKPKVDFDFLVERINSQVDLNDRWELGKNRYGNIKLRKNNITIDLVPIQNVYYLNLKGFEFNLKNFLSCTPLNIQSILFDIENSELIGDVGMRSINERVIKINNYESAIYAAMKKGISINEMIDKKTRELNFRADYTFT